jgi:hypothetical protein
LGSGWVVIWMTSFVERRRNSCMCWSAAALISTADRFFDRCKGEWWRGGKEECSLTLWHIGEIEGTRARAPAEPHDATVSFAFQPWTRPSSFIASNPGSNETYQAWIDMTLLRTKASTTVCRQLQGNFKGRELMASIRR